uniref:Uncharacterized protein n=1 Tax=Gallus gallus TaxID=9031 RepID=A0A8V1AIH1_CHICK
MRTAAFQVVLQAGLGAGLFTRAVVTGYVLTPNEARRAGFHTEAPGFAFRADYLAFPLQTAKPYFYPAVQCSGLFFVLQCCWFSLLGLWAAFSLWSPVALGVPQCPFGGGRENTRSSLQLVQSLL